MKNAFFKKQNVNYAVDTQYSVERTYRGVQTIIATASGATSGFRRHAAGLLLVPVSLAAGRRL
jgi:hypothetical protein